MTKYELAINEEGEPFAVPPEVAGWRVRRASDGRGRPALVHARGKGKPLVVAVDASHADLLAAAGPGRYRLEAVDAEQHKIDGIPAACTGPLASDGTPDSHEDGSEVSTVGRPNFEAVVCQLVTANARMVEKALEQMGTVMGGVAELLNAAHNAGITSRPPPPPAPPVPILTLVHDDGDDDDGDDDDGDDDDGDDDDNGSGADQGAVAKAPGIPEMLQFIIKEAIANAMPLIVEKMGANGASIAGIPLEAILDWRKAVPTAEPGSRPTSAAPAAVRTSEPREASGPTMRRPTAPDVDVDVDVPDAAGSSTHAGAASSGHPPFEAVPAEAERTSSSTPSPDETAALFNAHIMKIWQGLAPPERARAGQLIAQLDPEGRAALLAELARLTVPEAIARARAVIEAQSPTVPQLQITSTKGYTS